MIEEVKYKGFTAAYSDYESTDGEVAAMCNLVPNNGSLSPVQHERTIFKLSPEKDVVFVHQGDKFKNYIIKCNNNGGIFFTQDGKNFQAIIGEGGLSQVSSEVEASEVSSEVGLSEVTSEVGSSEVTSEVEAGEVGSEVEAGEVGSEVGLRQVTAIGNTLMLLTGKGTIHCLWKQDKNCYQVLGGQLPDIDISFGLQGTLKRGESFGATLDYFVNTFGGTSGWNLAPWDKVNIGAGFIGKVREDKVQELNNLVLGKVNKFIAEYYTRGGKFIYPFFVRYALRLYDGSLTRHSAPILMLPSTCCSPMCVEDGFHLAVRNGKLSVLNENLTWRIIGMVCDLDYQVHTDLSVLDNWKDIIKGVDVYISAPIYTFKQAGEVEGVAISSNTKDRLSQNKSVCKLNGNDVYEQVDWLTTYNKIYNPNEDLQQGINAVIELPRVPQKTLIENIKTCQDFYLLRSFNIDELTVSAERKIISVEEDYFKSLVNRQHMGDDYDSHDTIIAKRAVMYNQRVNYANLSKVLFNGFKLPYTNAFANGLKLPIKVRAFVYIKQGGREVVVDSGEANIDVLTPIYYFYYPNANAYKVVFEAKGGFENNLNTFNPYKVYYKEVNLERHIGLNGAFWFGDFNSLLTVPAVTLKNAPMGSSLADRTILMHNKIYTSKVGNPFVFPVLGINSIGVGEIYGISSAAKALSEGQFGQFPLYAFTSDGVWALEVAQNGSYHAKQPITRDVCVDADSITQMEHSVLFATSRGIMLLSGSSSQCITDILYSEEVFRLANLPKGNEIIKLAGLSNENFDYVRFEEYIKDSGMIYDYSHQRIILYNPTRRYAYIYSLDSKMWGMMQSNILHGVNSYPEALAMTSDNKLVDFTNYSKISVGLTGRTGQTNRTGQTGRTSLTSLTGQTTFEIPVKTLVVTRPLKLGGADVLKTIRSIIQRGEFERGSVKTILYGSNDLYNWHLVWSSGTQYLRGFSGTPYKYFRIVSVGSLTAQESLSGASIDVKARFNNQLR